jgi:hypothetical protein
MQFPQEPCQALALLLTLAVMLPAMAQQPYPQQPYPPPAGPQPYPGQPSPPPQYPQQQYPQQQYPQQQYPQQQYPQQQYPQQQYPQQQYPPPSYPPQSSPQQPFPQQPPGPQPYPPPPYPPQQPYPPAGYPPPSYAQPADAQHVVAVWTPKELRFVYMGFTATYSCDGLRDRVWEILLALGARKDLEVRESPCSAPLGTPAPFPGVMIKMNVLTPASAATPPGTPTLYAHWKKVDLTASHEALKAAGECELIEQVKQSVLPLFTVRNVEYKSNCIPYQLSVGGTQLRAEALVVDEPPPNAPAAGSGR